MASNFELKAGMRLRSAVCDTEVVVVKAAGEPVALRCGGVPLTTVEVEAPTAGPAPSFAEGTLVGKRYTDDAETIELLCTKAGAGSLSIGDVMLRQKGAKPLPASD